MGTLKFIDISAILAIRHDLGADNDRVYGDWLRIDAASARGLRADGVI